ncbi:MAG: LamG domain-containing protein, partial [Tissierellales bacterium]|nr:LamG domain-containing protein [Tissierellales bacterium]
PINKDIIHILYTDGHPNREAVNVYGIYFDMSIDKFYDLSNTEITATKPFIPSNGTLILSPTSGDNSWIEDIIVTPVGDVRYLMTYYPNYIGVNYINKEVYYAELSSGILSTPIKIFDANSKNIGGISEPAYSSLSVFDKYNNDIIWAAKEVEGICEIFKVTKSGSLFTLVQKTSDNIYDQWRPLSTNNPTEEERVFWLKQISYIRWDDFNESLESFMIAYNQITTTTTTSTTTTIVLELLSNLISIWELDETSDTTVIDSHASHNGTNNGAIINQEGITDLTPCYLFDGINDYINIPSLNNLLVDNPSTLSISFWFKTTSTSPQSILGVFNTGSTTGISIVLNLTATGNAAGKFRFFIRDNNADVTEYCTTNAYPQIYNDNWHHIVMIRNGASMTFYLDGVSILLTQTGFENAAVFSTFTYDLYLGNGNNRGVTYNTFNGNLDQIAIWGRALNQSHVDILNNNGNGLSFDNWGSTTTTTTTLP